MNQILIIDDDAITRTLLSDLLKKHGYSVLLAADGDSGLNQIKAIVPDLVITDYSMPGKSGLDVVIEVTKLYPGLPVIMLTAFGDVPLTIKSIQAGAFDYIEKPIEPKKLLETIRNGLSAFEKHKSISKTISITSRLAIEENLPVGKSGAMMEIFKNIGRISMNRVNVLITGEPGTGKEKTAQLIHHSGITRDYPILFMNCRASNQSNHEAELFGYARGSITGTRGEKTGKLEQADEGTVFLDEFTDLSSELQARLLNVLRERTFIKPGVDEPLPLKARIIASSSKKLDELVQEGKLLKDLYYQLNVFNIHIPPLHQRKEDIPALVEQLVMQINKKLDFHIQKIEEGVIELLQKHDWPGNIRELENTLMQAMLLSRGNILEKEHIAIAKKESNVATDKTRNLVSLEEVERDHIKHILEAVGWVKQEAARVLKITRPTLDAKIAKYKLKYY